MKLSELFLKATAFNEPLHGNLTLLGQQITRYAAKHHAIREATAKVLDAHADCRRRLDGCETCEALADLRRLLESEGV